MSLSEDDKIRIRQALGLIENVADRRQSNLTIAIHMVSDQSALVSSAALTSAIAYSRSVDTLERVASELAGLLNLPPTAPDPPCPVEGLAHE